MSAVWKFPLAIKGEDVVEMPEGAEVLHLAVQGEQPCIWALVSVPTPGLEPRRFQVVMTGETLRPLDAGEERVHVGSFLMMGGAFVGHVFEVRER